MYSTVDSTEPMADIADPVTGVIGAFNHRFPHMRGATIACYTDMVIDQEGINGQEEATYNMQEDEAFLDDQQRRFWNKFTLALTRDAVAKLEAQRAIEMEDLEDKDEMEKLLRHKQQLEQGGPSVFEEHQAKKQRRG